MGNEVVKGGDLWGHRRAREGVRAVRAGGVHCGDDGGMN